jgi:N-methylhydantoinase B
MPGANGGDILSDEAAAVHGSHINHMIFTLPVFNHGELVAFSSSMAHAVDPRHGTRTPGATML